MTEEIAKQFLQDDESVDLRKFLVMEDAAVELLGSSDATTINLDGLRVISETAAKSLAKFGGELSLDSLENISDSTLRALSKKVGGCITLNGIRHLSNAAIDFLIGCEAVLHLENWVLPAYSDRAKTLFKKLDSRPCVGNVEGPFIRVTCSKCWRKDEFELDMDAGEDDEAFYESCLEREGWSENDELLCYDCKDDEEAD